MTQKLFADCLGISPATLSSIFTGRTLPTLTIVDAIKKRFPTISTDWIMFGKEPMYTDGQSGDITSQSAQASPSKEPILSFDNNATATQQAASQQSDTSNVRSINPRYEESNDTVKIFDKPQRKIVEIRIFYDDQTWETFIPKK